MAPAEIVAIREGLRLTRREFAPKLLISERTLIRWEKGETEPNEAHLTILRRMQQYSREARPGLGVRYDPGTGPSALDGLSKERDVITATLKEMGMRPMSEKWTKDGRNWWLTFDPRWPALSTWEFSLICSGTKDPTWPILSFEVRVTPEKGSLPRVVDEARHAASVHALGFDLVTQRKGQTELSFCYRLFTTGFNADTVKHVAGNLASCCERLHKALSHDGKAGPTRGQ